MARNRTTSSPHARLGAPLALAAACGLAAPAAGQLTEPFPAIFDLHSLEPASGGDGSLGFMVGSRVSGEHGGTSVASAGDVNGDGVDDVIIAGPPNLSWVVFGRAGGGIPAAVDPFALDGTDGFRLVGAGGEAGFAVASAGDVNGDGVGDIIAGSESGQQAYAVFGRVGGGFPAEIDLEALDGSDGFRLQGDRAGTGWAVASAGDVNNDGVDDVILGVIGGPEYVVYGRREPFPASVDLTGLGSSGTGFAIGMSRPGDQRLGAAVASAGDINGDGIDDIVMGAPGVYHEYYYGGSGGYSDSGDAYVIFGSETLPAFIDVTRLNGADGFRLAGFGEAMAGASVGRAGDFNADGFDDVIIGAPGGFGVVNQAFIVFGRNTTTGPAFPATIFLSTFSGEDGVQLEGEWATAAGASVAGVGDVNGDGIDDVIAAAPYHGISGEPWPVNYVVFGGPMPPAAITLSELDGEAGFRLIGAGGGYPLEDNASGAAAAGDVNGDGVGDIIVATGAGFRAAYIVYGRTPDTPCYADCDGSGELDFLDFLCFQNQFAAGDPQADCDENGELDFFDFLCFQNAFAAGCP